MFGFEYEIAKEYANYFLCLLYTSRDLLLQLLLAGMLDDAEKDGL